MFERLTIRIDGIAFYDNNGIPLIPAEILDTPFVRQALDRLAAYEDSGLSPEDCAAYAKAEKEKRIVVFESHERLKEVQELAQAKAEGRLMVLPVKVGDTVYNCEGMPFNG